MKKLLVLLLAVFSFAIVNAQKAKDKIDPVIENSFPSEDGFIIYKSSVHLCASADVSDNTGFVLATILTIDPNGPMSWKPEQNIGRATLWAYVPNLTHAEKCFDITGLAAGEHTLQIDVWDYAKNQTTKTIKFIVVE